MHDDVPLHPLIRERWSPRSFDEEPVSLAQLRCLFEAARWAPSSHNAQPWFFLLARRENRLQYQRILDCLFAKNQRWARHAPVLAVSVAAVRYVGHACAGPGARTHDGEINRHAFHDVGLATAQLTLQATALGLVVRQIAGMDGERVRDAFQLPPDYEPVAGLAIGRPGNADRLLEDLRQQETAPRQRRPLHDFVFEAQWGQSPTWLDASPCAAEASVSATTAAISTTRTLSEGV